MPLNGMKGITVKVDAQLHAEVTQYIQNHDMTMSEFVALALQDELHPKIQEKEGKNMGNVKTLAFQIPEELFWRIKEYLQRHNMSQKDFVIGLIERELKQEQTECQAHVEEQAETVDSEEMKDMEQASEGQELQEEMGKAVSAESGETAGNAAVQEEEKYEESQDSGAETESESEDMGLSMGM